MSISLPIHGRGASSNPPNRFIPLYRESIPGWTDEEDPAPRTRFFKDTSRSVIATNDSPDIGFTHSLNPYRGCEHGCSYCYARPFHEHLGLSAGLDFESQIFVKEDAPELLRKELMSPKWVPQFVAIGGVTDPYQPVERRLELTRRCLQVFLEFRNPAGIVTKSALVARDRDLLGELAQYQAAAVYMSVTTLDPELARKMEPRAAAPLARLRAIRELSDAGVPVGVLVAPIIPGLNDHEAPAILESAAQAGALSAGYVPLRLPFAVKDIFVAWLEQHYPNRKERVLGRIRNLRGGKLYDSRWGVRMRGEGEWSEVFGAMFALHRRRVGLADHGMELSAAHFTPGRLRQGELFE
ncbi:MAG TPA: PA0069 family radical SAM protein [Gemmataceae bacterium]|nr:PA0069 family radical SAM protein [Gemmataceae bacterium]